MEETPRIFSSMAASTRSSPSTLRFSSSLFNFSVFLNQKSISFLYPWPSSPIVDIATVHTNVIVHRRSRFCFMGSRFSIWYFRSGSIISSWWFNPRHGISDLHPWRRFGLHSTLAGKSYSSGDFLLQKAMVFVSGDGLVVGLVTGSKTTSFHPSCCSTISARQLALSLADLFVSIFRDVFVVPVFIKSSSRAALLVGLSLVDNRMMFGGSLCGWFFLNAWTTGRSSISCFIWLVICQGSVSPFVRSWWCECSYGVCMLVFLFVTVSAIQGLYIAFVWFVTDSAMYGIAIAFVFLRVFG